MPKPTVLLAMAPMSDEEFRRATGVRAAKKFETKFPARAGRAKLQDAFGAWQRTVEAPKAVENPEVQIRAVSVNRAALTRFRAALDGGLSPEVMRKNELGPSELFGTVFSALATYGYVQLEGEYRRRKAAGGAAAQRADGEWQQHIASFSEAFAAAGLPGIGEAELRGFAKELNANKANRDAIIDIWNSGVDAKPVALTSRALVASFVPVTGVVIDTARLITPIADLCSKPFAEGSFTKHFSHSISLSVRVPYPCGISWSGIKWCHKTVTLAGVSFSVDVTVGYRVSCCGASAWGAAGVQVCATIVGISVCAQCTASITGVAGVARTPVASGCEYGLGITARLKCTLAGATILDIAYPFGWTVTGPCPPAGLC